MQEVQVNSGCLFVAYKRKKTEKKEPHKDAAFPAKINFLNNDISCSCIEILFTGVDSGKGDNRFIQTRHVSEIWKTLKL